ncbi:MAG: hypothetical protein OQK98_06025 [Gammaproteobacteria bacterium]|nr:hypothetical protein [Gammaproteobacteria bacterium]
MKFHNILALCTRFTPLVVIFTLFIPLQAHAGRGITSLPHYENFNQNDYGDIVWVSQGATHNWISNEGFEGSGVARFTPPINNGGEGYSGLGQFTGLHNLNTTGPRQLNVRILIKHGPTYHNFSRTNKLMIFNRDNAQTRPMIMNRLYSNYDWRTLRACHGTWCQPNDALASDDFKIGSTSSNDLQSRFDEWVSVELEANLDQGVINLYIYTADGQVGGLYSTNPFIDANDPRTGVFSFVDIIGGYFNAHNRPADDGAWFLIDELVIDDNYIGPPASFVVIPRAAEQLDSN